MKRASVFQSRIILAGAIACVAGAVLPVAAIAQGDDPLDQLMTKRTIWCTDVTLNCSLLIPRYHLEGKRDSVDIILNYWERKCGLIEPIRRARIALALDDGTFKENLYDEDIVPYLVRYRYRLTSKENPEVGWDDDPVDDKFDLFTWDLASGAIEKTTAGTPARFFAEYYGNRTDTLFGQLRRENFSGTRLKASYDTFVERLLDETEGNLALLAGYWVPIGNNRILGNHPELGFMIGAKSRRWMYDLTLLFRFLKAKEPYLVGNSGILQQTSHYIGGYIGIDGGFDLLKTWTHEVHLLAGLGYDGFEALTEEDNGWSASIGSLNLNVGLGYRVYLAEDDVEYVAVQGRYNVVNYVTSGGSDLSGHAISLRVIFGWAGNRWKKETLQLLGYSY